MKVFPIPCRRDNYAYVLACMTSKEAIAIDPVDPVRVAQVLHTHHLRLTHILTTHHHADHSGGNIKMKTLFPGVPVLGGDVRTSGLDYTWEEAVGRGKSLALGTGVTIRALSTPGHTTDSLTYLVTTLFNTTPSKMALFTGDCMFAGGCGRLFEGTPEMMYQSLIKIIAGPDIPNDADIYCGHEYTKKNLEFGLTIEPENLDIQDKLNRIQDLTSTMPSTMGEERRTNVFLRCDRLAHIIPEAQGDPVRCLAILRQLKDQF